MDASIETPHALNDVSTSNSGLGRLAIVGATPSSKFSPRFIKTFSRLFGWLLRLWFRPRVQGWENIPSGPCIFVGNHSGYGVMEILVLLTEWYRKQGFGRPVAGLCHDIGFWPPFKWVVLPIGGIRASRQEGWRAVQKGIDLLVYPGGDLDALRPFRMRYSIRWGNRRGFLDLATNAGVPLVPVVNCGSHAQYTVLPGGRLISRLLGLRKVRLAEWRIPLGAVCLFASSGAWLAGLVSGGWVWVSIFFAFCPNPTRMDIKFLPSVDARSLIENHGGVEGAQEALRQTMESELRALASHRRTPWF